MRITTKPTTAIVAKQNVIVIPSKRKYNLHKSVLVSASEQLLIKKTGVEMRAITPIDMAFISSP